jgi:AcrR family transcriptional regulator
MYQMVHSSGVSVKAPRQRLLDGAIDYVAEHGLADVSLRTLAAALGTSHRMLIHHFGSKELLWVEIVRTVEARQRDVLAQILPGTGLPVAEAMWTWWKHISDPLLWPNERLFFEIYGQALQGRPHTTQLLDGIVEDWLDPATEINVALGVPPELARAHARLGVAVTRGLLLDLLATRDVGVVDAAMEAFIDVYTSWLERASEHPGARAPQGVTGSTAPGRIGTGFGCSTSPR